MHIKKRLRVFIALIALLYLLTTIQDTYAKYASSANANTNFSIARWNVVINNQDIKFNSNFSNTITPTLEENSNIKSNVIAPTSKGYFDIIINGSNTDVTYQYTLTLSLPESNTVNDLKITKYTIGDDPTEHEFGELPNSIIQTVNLDAENKITQYRFYLEWYEGENENLNNAGDTLQTQNGRALFNVDVNVIQVAN